MVRNARDARAHAFCTVPRVPAQILQKFNRLSAPNTADQSELDRSKPGGLQTGGGGNEFKEEFALRTAIPTNGPRTQEVVSFGAFRLFPSKRVLKKADETVKLGSRAFDILLVLVQHAGEVVGQRELIGKVWPGLFVEEVTLRVHVTALRKALDTGEGGERYLTNVPGRGYCFVAPTSRDTAGLPTADDFPEAHYPLPPLLARMVGRDEIVSEICHKLTTERFVTIVGPGGLGKTTVALSVAHTLLPEFFGAVCFVELSPVTDPHLLAPTVVSAFGLPVQSGDPIPGLVGHLRGRPVLLILDGSEHLVSEAAALSERLFAELPQLHLLVTSREILRVGDENVYRLSPLETPPDGSSLTAAELSDSRP